MEKPDFNELKCLSSDAKGARLGGRGPGLESKLLQLQSPCTSAFSPNGTRQGAAPSAQLDVRRGVSAAGCVPCTRHLSSDSWSLCSSVPLRTPLHLSLAPETHLQRLKLRCLFLSPEQEFQKGRGIRKTYKRLPQSVPQGRFRLPRPVFENTY